MLTEEQIEKNYNDFITILSFVKVVNVEPIVNYLTSTDFFIAPASTVFHNNYPGGLCEHSLNVYKRLVELIKQAHLTDQIPIQSAIIVGLLHDISKANFYEKYYRNVKDENGNWTQVEQYRVKDSKDRYTVGTHAANSLSLLTNWIPLTIEEQAAILNHMGGCDDMMTNRDQTAIFNKYKLAALLHMADFMATYIDEV